MKVSVVVCTYNRVQWLPKCLKSLEQQVPQPDEIIVVDGPSTDGTREMLELLVSKGDGDQRRQTQDPNDVGGSHGGSHWRSE